MGQNSNPVVDRFLAVADEVCYGKVRHHMNVVSQVDTPVDLFELCQAAHFESYAITAVRTMAQLVLEEADALVARHRHRLSRARLGELQPTEADRPGVEEGLGQHCAYLREPLETLQAVVEGVAARWSSPGMRGFERGWDYSQRGANIGGAIAGPLGAFIGVIAGTLFGGNQLQEEVDADFARLDQAVDWVLRTYTQVMEAVKGTACEMMDKFETEVLSA